jgi:hypothetical protein
LAEAQQSDAKGLANSNGFYGAHCSNSITGIVYAMSRLIVPFLRHEVNPNFNRNIYLPCLVFEGELQFRGEFATFCAGR